MAGGLQSVDARDVPDRASEFDAVALLGLDVLDRGESVGEEDELDPADVPGRRGGSAGPCRRRRRTPRAARGRAAAAALPHALEAPHRGGDVGAGDRAGRNLAAVVAADQVERFLLDPEAGDLDAAGAVVGDQRLLDLAGLDQRVDHSAGERLWSERLGPLDLGVDQDLLAEILGEGDELRGRRRGSYAGQGREGAVHVRAMVGAGGDSEVVVHAADPVGEVALDDARESVRRR